jgi:hypothetical protein
MNTATETPFKLQPVRDALLRDAECGSDPAAIDVMLERLPIFLYRAAREALRAHGGRGPSC